MLQTRSRHSLYIFFFLLFVQEMPGYLRPSSCPNSTKLIFILHYWIVLFSSRRSWHCERFVHIVTVRLVRAAIVIELCTGM